MTAFHDRAGRLGGGPELWCEDASLSDIAATVNTPVYVYSSSALEQAFASFRNAFAGRAPLIAYAVKANPSLSVLATLARLGSGADTVSEGEIRRSLAAGVPAERIVFSGVGKTGRELAFALEAGVGVINVESEPELERLAAIAQANGVRARIALRVNPDVVAGGHAKISTGQGDSKFGVSLGEAERLYARAAALPGIEPLGLACHIGSQVDDLAPLEAAFTTLRRLAERLRVQGLPVSRLDLGGGLAVAGPEYPDPPDAAAYAAIIERVLAGLDVELTIEPGRAIAAQAGVLLSRVIHVHQRTRTDGEPRRFLVLDAAMNDLIRPALYDAHHDIRPVVVTQDGAERLAYDVVGPVCETGDTFARGRALPRLRAGDLVALMTAGAYGASMSSEYNGRPLVPEVLVRGERFTVVRRRPGYEEMLAREALAPWLVEANAGAEEAPRNSAA